MFWSAYEAERSFREELISALRNILPNECILSSPSALVASATDATDLRMELPLLVVEPDSAEQVAALVKLANDMKFALIPRGGGSGMTGGAVPARKRTVIVSLTRLTKIGPIDRENMTVTVEAGAITQNVIKAVGEKYGLQRDVIPASFYGGKFGKDIVTVSASTELMINKNVSEDIAYKMVKAMCEKRDDIVIASPFWKSFMPEKAGQGLALPLHPGAAKYYKEKGWL